MSGWMVKITKADDVTSPKLYAVAESDPRRALILVSKALDRSPPADLLQTVGELSHAMVQSLGLKGEEILDVTDNPPCR